MRKHSLLLRRFLYMTAVLLLALCGPLCVSAAGVTKADAEKETFPDDPDELLRIADEEIFQRVGHKETFWETQGYLNEVLPQDSLHQYFVQQGRGGDVLMSLFPASERYRSTSHWLDIREGWEDEFHVSFTLQRTENVPDGAGGHCWLGYSNKLMKQSGFESGVILYPGDHAYYFTSYDGETTIEPIGELFRLNQDDAIVFEFIRLKGVTYFYANGKYLFSYEDRIREKVSFEAGSEIFKDGYRVRCDFDDFSMRYR